MATSLHKILLITKIIHKIHPAFRFFIRPYEQSGYYVLFEFHTQIPPTNVSGSGMENQYP